MLTSSAVLALVLPYAQLPHPPPIHPLLDTYSPFQLDAFLAFS